MTHKTKVISPRGLVLLGFFAILILLFAMVWGALATENPHQAAAPSNWSAVYTESFEGDLSANWTIEDLDGATNGEYYWGATDAISATEGTLSMWVTAAGADGALLDPAVDNYPHNAVSSMIRSAVSLTDTTSARLTFDYWSQTEENVDILQVRVSTDTLSYEAVTTLSGSSNGWQTTTIDLSDYAGEETVSLQFLFSSSGVTADRGIFIDNLTLEALSGQSVYLPLMKVDPTLTPTFTPTPTATPPYYYFEDFEGPEQDWPVKDNRHDSTDCWRWFYENGDYNVDICDDRTDVKVSPLVDLPNGDYQIEVDARFRLNGGWWTSYGIIFDGKDDPDPNNPDLGDYYMLWVLWTSREDSPKALWKILRDVPGAQEDVIDWQPLDNTGYHYGVDGLGWNRWKIVRTDDTISIYINDEHLATLTEPRPRDNYQTLFGVYASTYETDMMQAGFDNYRVKALSGDARTAQSPSPSPYVISGPFSLESLLPTADELDQNNNDE